MNYSFNGANKIISVADAPINGAINVDIQELYSRWVDWVLTADNSKYIQAMRVVGGDPLPGSKQLGLTYFLMNDWKIRPYEANHTFTLNGNLYSEDGSSPFISTIGSFNVMIVSSVSNLVDSTVQQLPEIEYASYNGGVTLDAINGTDSSEYPYGTPLHPCKTTANSYAIRMARGFNTIYLKSDLTLSGIPDGVLNNLTLIGIVGFGENAKTLTINNVLITNCRAKNLKVTGTAKSGSTADLTNCTINNLNNAEIHALECVITSGVYSSTELDQCTIDGNIVISDNGVFSGTRIVFNGDFTNITHGNNTTVSIDINSGYLMIKNSTNGCLSEFNVKGGEVELDDSCSGGEFYIEGIGNLYGDPEELGMIVKANNLISSAMIGSSLTNEQDEILRSLATTEELRVVNIGVKNASLLIPHTTNI